MQHVMGWGGGGGRERWGHEGPTLVRHGLPELFSDEGHEGMRKLEQSIKGIHKHLHAARNGLGNSSSSFISCPSCQH